MVQCISEETSKTPVVTFKGADQQMSSSEENRLPRGGGGQFLLSQSSQYRPHQLRLGVGQLSVAGRFLQRLAAGQVLQLKGGGGQ